MTHDERMGAFERTDLYPVTCHKLSDGRSSLEILDGILAGGAGIVQLREKDMSMAELYQLAMAFRARTRRAGALLMINDHVDLALAVAADGVHLGQDDLPIAAARSIAPELIIGRSTHSRSQALEAQAEGADYVNLGPIFRTGTKPEHTEFLGPRAIEEIGPELGIPFTVMGGITGDTIDEVVSAGARHIAVVTAVTRARDVAAEVARLRARICR